MKSMDFKQWVERTIEQDVYCLQNFVGELMSEAYEAGVVGGKFAYDNLSNGCLFPECGDFPGGTWQEHAAYLESLRKKIDAASDEDEATRLSGILAELEDLEPEPQEIFQWFAISQWLYEHFLNLGEPVLALDDTNFWWGRTTCGQALSTDSVWQTLYTQLEREHAEWERDREPAIDHGEEVQS
jgi:hypothetical protein